MPHLASARIGPTGRTGISPHVVGPRIEDMPESPIQIGL
jgi:hypothetical protein